MVLIMASIVFIPSSVVLINPFIETIPATPPSSLPSLFIIFSVFFYLIVNNRNALIQLFERVGTLGIDLFYCITS